jgi:hypothetical protein
MQRAKTILPLFILVVMVLNWVLVGMCTAHPLGHDHHSHDGPSPCELRAQCSDTSFWPPMDCQKLHQASDEYQVPEEHLVKPTLKTWVVAAMVLQLLSVDLPDRTHATPPDPGSTSEPPLPANTLRGPPIV